MYPVFCRGQARNLVALSNTVQNCFTHSPKLRSPQNYSNHPKSLWRCLRCNVEQTHWCRCKPGLPNSRNCSYGPRRCNQHHLSRKMTDEEKAAKVQDYRDKFANPYKAASLGYIDEIIHPRDTRKKVIDALEMTQNKRKSNPPKKHGNIPL